MMRSSRAGKSTQTSAVRRLLWRASTTAPASSAALVEPRRHHGESCCTGQLLKHPRKQELSTHAQQLEQQRAAREQKAAADNAKIEKDFMDRCVEEAAKMLPDQGILEHFVHQNPLSNFETMPFDQAIKYTHEIEKKLSAGQRCLLLVGIDPRKRVSEALGELCSVFLDRGAAKWTAPGRDQGLLHFFAKTEGLGFALWRHQARQFAKTILEDHEKDNSEKGIRDRAKRILEENLRFYGLQNEKEFAYAIRAAMIEQRGWSSMFHRMERIQSECPENTKVRLIELLAVRSILMRSSIQSLAMRQGISPSGVTEWLKTAPFKEVEDDDHHKHHVSAIASSDQECPQQQREMMEQAFQQTLIESIGIREIPKPSTRRPKLQVWACIDDRMESLRRHIEDQNPENIETFGLAGFFGVPMICRPFDGREEMVQAPFGVRPGITVVEKPDPCDKHVDEWKHRRKLLAQFRVFIEKASFSPIQSLAVSGILGPLFVARLLLTSFFPLGMHKLSKAVENFVMPPVRTFMDTPIAPEVAAKHLADIVQEIGIAQRFARLIIILGHGNSSNNNPFQAAYNCGACQGHDGGPNARVVARLANNPEVRRVLEVNHGIVIPKDTWFVAADHNTCSDELEYFDTDDMPESHGERFSQARRIIDRALGKNAWERCYRFLLAKPASAHEALEHVKRRSVDFSEVRPELNHAGNAAVVVGRRDLTKGKFLDRRAFLPSYDPFVDDDRGTNLQRVLTPALVVSSGINLEYLFSTMDVDGHGAGTKVPLNIVGNIGVLQGVSGDLHPGLPSQMTEMHTPIRAHFVVDAPVDRVEAVLNRNVRLLNLVRNEWVRFFVRDPFTNKFYYQQHGKYWPIESNTAETCISFEAHHHHGVRIALRENFLYYGAQLTILAACFGPIIYHYGLLLPSGALTLAPIIASPHGAIVAVCATSLTLPTLAFSRRYLHGEFIFGRFSVLCAGLLLGFNTVATSPDIHQMLGGWTLFGFASTFLIGMYNERPSVRNNATYAFAAYKLADFAMLAAAACTMHGSFAPIPGTGYGEAAAAGILLAALFKSSQFPLTVLFARSMEGPTPSSALGYAGLSAHIGVVLLATTMPLWFGYDWARMSVGGVGLLTACTSTFVANVRADRKGAIAYATSASLGVIFFLLSLGYKDLALYLSFGHAAFRMLQILRAPNSITDYVTLRAALGGVAPWKKSPPEWAFRLALRFRRFDTDFHLLNIVQAVLGDDTPHKSRMGPLLQWIITAAIVIFAGFPFTPVTHLKEHFLVEEAMDEGTRRRAMVFAVLDFIVSVTLVRLVFTKVLSERRFHTAWTGNKAKH